MSSSPQYKVVDPFTPQDDGEIDLGVGDQVIVKKDLGNGWALGRNITRNLSGIFPTKHVILETFVASDPVTGKLIEGLSDEEFTLPRDKLGDVVKPIEESDSDTKNPLEDFLPVDSPTPDSQNHVNLLLDVPDNQDSLKGPRINSQPKAKPHKVTIPSPPALPVQPELNSGRPDSVVTPPPEFRGDAPEGVPRIPPQHGKQRENVYAEKPKKREEKKHRKDCKHANKSKKAPKKSSKSNIYKDAATSRLQEPLPVVHEDSLTSNGDYCSIDDTDSEFPDEFLTHSLPSPKKSRAYVDHKPHMLVKPNLNPRLSKKSGNKDSKSPPGHKKSEPCQGAPAAEDNMASSNTDPDVPEPPVWRQSPQRPRSNVTRFRVSAPNGPAALPDSTRSRVSAPPGQLPTPTEQPLDPDVIEEVPESPSTPNEDEEEEREAAAAAAAAALGQPCTSRGPGPGPPHMYQIVKSRERNQNVANETLERDCTSTPIATTVMCANSIPPASGGPRERLEEIKRRYYQDYRTMECPQMMDPKDTCCTALPSGGTCTNVVRRHPNTPPEEERASNRRGAYHHHHTKNKSTQLVASVIAGFMIGGFLFLWMYCALGYGLLAAAAVSVVASLLLCIFFALSRLCRCVAALMIPSISTTRGRLSLLIIISGFLLGGPITNIYRNMLEVSKSMACSAEQAYNQSLLLYQPFDAMLVRLNQTVAQLHVAADNVSVGLHPLRHGITRMENEILQGKSGLDSTGVACQNMIAQAYDACNQGIRGAQDQCFDVMEALGNVYNHAREVLDKINPELWSPRQRRRSREGQGGTVTAENAKPSSRPSGTIIPESKRDVCEPLNIQEVCQALNETWKLCSPTGWAGQAIYTAINQTKKAMLNLRKVLHFKLTPEHYFDQQSNYSWAIYEVQKHVIKDYNIRTAYFHIVINVLQKIIPVALLILMYVSYSYLKHYLSKDDYDNLYINKQFVALDERRAEFGGDVLLPLKKYEKNYVIDGTVNDLSPPEEGLFKIGLFVMFLHMLVTMLCYLFDYILYWVLFIIHKHSEPNYQIKGTESLRLVVSGKGVLSDLMNVFLDEFHAAKLFRYAADPKLCLPKPHEPWAIYLLVILIMYVFVLLAILLKAYMLRLRSRIAAYFYPEREKARIVHLYNLIMNQRVRLLRTLRHKARVSSNQKQILQRVSVGNWMAAKMPAFRVLMYEQSRCLICHSIEDQNFHDCPTEKCTGIYCESCYNDLERSCPLCHQTPDYEEEEEEELEDDLDGETSRPYNATNSRMSLYV